MFTVTADPTVAFVDAIKAKLAGDALLGGLVNGIFGHLSQAARTNYPYVVLGHRTSTNVGGAMQLAGGMVSIQIDAWSAAKGPYEASAILSRVYALLERQPLSISGFTMVGGSLTREFQEVFDEPDDDSPEKMLYHGVQRWLAEVHESV